MIEEQEREEFVSIMEMLGTTLYLTFKHAENPTQGGLKDVTQHWGKLADMIVDYMNS